MDVFHRLGRRSPGAGSQPPGPPTPNPRPTTFVALLVLALAALSAAGALSAAPSPATSAQPATPPPGLPATAEQIRAAQEIWSKTGHAETYDNGMGANTTCASCKSPRNWDPTQVAATEAAHDCASCKREPGQPRPDLPGGIPVPQDQWKNIGCDVCHRPIGDSYSTAVAFWNQQKGAYEPVANATELCEKCHEGSHGFDVIYEQANSPAHKGWECTKCHGSHGLPANGVPVKCTDCHDVTKGPSVRIHGSHPKVNCTGCHDAGKLPIWQDPLPDSRHFGEYIPERFAHTLRSWPSHNIETKVDCRRCHHPQGELQGKLISVGSVPKNPDVRAAIVPNVGCSDPACHSSGATFEWCPVFPRDVAPTPEAKRP